MKTAGHNFDSQSSTTTILAADCCCRLVQCGNSSGRRRLHRQLHLQSDHLHHAVWGALAHQWLCHCSDDAAHFCRSLLGHRVPAKLLLWVPHDVDRLGDCQSMCHADFPLCEIRNVTNCMLGLLWLHDSFGRYNIVLWASHNLDWLGECQGMCHAKVTLQPIASTA